MAADKPLVLGSSLYRSCWGSCVGVPNVATIGEIESLEETFATAPKVKYAEPWINYTNPFFHLYAV